MKPKIFGIIGNPVTHSFSPDYFNGKFKHLKFPFEYKRFALDDISEVEGIFQHEKNLVGLNVTSPFKQSIIPYLSDCDLQAKTLNAVNTIHIAKHGRNGYNTDIIGFEATLDSLKLKNDKCLVLGTGGAASAIIYVLNKRNHQFVQVSRNADKAQIKYHQIDYHILTEYPVIINTTPLGMAHNRGTKPNLPYSIIGPKNILIDLVYAPRVSSFLYEGLRRGARIKNGYEMLVSQAEASWKIWTNGM
ncbi:MAG: shikimate dehydrogenase [Bacteroidia bacterium]|jgi:shikimate dehydrogenase